MKFFKKLFRTEGYNKLAESVAQVRGNLEKLDREIAEIIGTEMVGFLKTTPNSTLELRKLTLNKSLGDLQKKVALRFRYIKYIESIFNKYKKSVLTDMKSYRDEQNYGSLYSNFNRGLETLTYLFSLLKNQEIVYKSFFNHELPRLVAEAVSNSKSAEEFSSELLSKYQFLVEKFTKPDILIQNAQNVENIFSDIEINLYRDNLKLLETDIGKLLGLSLIGVGMANLSLIAGILGVVILGKRIGGVSFGFEWLKELDNKKMALDSLSNNLQSKLLPN